MKLLIITIIILILFIIFFLKLKKKRGIDMELVSKIEVFDFIIEKPVDLNEKIEASKGKLNWNLTVLDYINRLESNCQFKGELEFLSDVKDLRSNLIKSRKKISNKLNYYRSISSM
ncbi:hypothetical protein [Flavivirga jejuensis]|uniref:Uncharacterized protein n=1 Tax=Flavivirga jejuensis TaxID=870487 RepID=A0ABT8WT23_9FLAO|nr:hypothetical protein [Flavivirga jejuensis]MDO5976311.1 hypothetical protein [Flavivirga jejuensis]